MSNNKVNQIITDRIIERIKTTGELPWSKPWTSINEVPRNLITGKNYRGINAFLLHAMAYSNPCWLTFKQAKQLGGTVKKGEKSTPVIFWKMFERENETDQDKKMIPVLRYFNVFNVLQCEGIPANKLPVIEPSELVVRLDIAEQIIANMPNRPDIRFDSRQACYMPMQDVVRMPAKDTFKSSESLYSVLFHELTHATGHGKRLNRPTITKPTIFGTEAYSREELLAEMGSSYLCAYCGILTETETNSAAYLQSWLNALKADPSMLVKAGSQAQKAFDYITNTSANENTVESIAA